MKFIDQFNETDDRDVIRRSMRIMRQITIESENESNYVLLDTMLNKCIPKYAELLAQLEYSDVSYEILWILVNLTATKDAKFSLEFITKIHNLHLLEILMDTILGREGVNEGNDYNSDKLKSGNSKLSVQHLALWVILHFSQDAASKKELLEKGIIEVLIEFLNTVYGKIQKLKPDTRTYVIWILELLFNKIEDKYCENIDKTFPFLLDTMFTEDLESDILEEVMLVLSHVMEKDDYFIDELTRINSSYPKA